MTAICRYCEHFDAGGDLGPLCRRTELMENHRVWGPRHRSVHDPYTLEECDKQGYYEQKRPIVPQQRIFGGWL